VSPRNPSALRTEMMSRSFVLVKPSVSRNFWVNRGGACAAWIAERISAVLPVATRYAEGSAINPVYERVGTVCGRLLSPPGAEGVGTT